MTEYARACEYALLSLFPEREKSEPVAGQIAPVLYDAMRYSLLAGGKRIRGSLMLAAADLLGGDLDAVTDAAVAVEMIHASSLIHDDLPGMDDDTLRRGKPTNHVVFGEGQAILAGDGLLNYAYEHLLAAALRRPERSGVWLAAIGEIARGAGVRGMMAGQCVDLLCEQEAAPSGAVSAREDGYSGDEARMLEVIQLGKTAAMFEYPLRAAARLSGGSDAEVDALGRYGRAFGRLFQVVDDILDIESSAEVLGKTTGKDQRSGKLTAVGLYGLDGARAMARRLVAEAEDAMGIFGSRGMFFLTLLPEMASRAY